MKKVIHAFLVLIILMVGILGLSAANAADRDICVQDVIQPHQLHASKMSSDPRGITYVNMSDIQFIDTIDTKNNTLRVIFKDEALRIQVNSVSEFIRKFKNCAGYK